METGMFFKILGFLLVVGVLTSLMSGAVLPTSVSPVYNQTFMNTTMTKCNYQTIFCITPGCPQNCYTVDTKDEWFGLPALITWVIASIANAVDFAYNIFLFISGIGGLISGSGVSLPEPLNFMFLIGILFAWSFLALEVLRRVIGVIWGN